MTARSRSLERMVRRYVWHCGVRRLEAKTVTLASPVEPTGSRQEPMLSGLSGGRLGKEFRTNDQRRGVRRSWEKTAVHKKRGVTPNDPKLSDRGVRRGTCMVGGKAAAEAGAVTHGAVRCSAWLGDVGLGAAIRNMRMILGALNYAERHLNIDSGGSHKLGGCCTLVDAVKKELTARNDQLI